jgi:16S rRNA (cytosine1402-N4)-methyltransferase
VVVESYHSLEDRLVKRAFTAATSVDVPPELPFVPEDRQPELRLVTRGAERANDEEIEQNPRAASVRLRAVERIRPRGSRSSSTGNRGAA